MTGAITPTVEVQLSADDLRSAMERDVRVGLTSSPKQLPPVYFYDERGSQLFDEITRLPEYYPTRAERSILDRVSSEIAGRSGADTLVELGAGTCEKSRVLLDAMRAAGRLRRFVPLDVSASTLWEAASALAIEYPGVAIEAVVADFHLHLDELPTDGVRLIAFLGGTIGNLDASQRRTFFDSLAKAMTTDDRLLLGTDLVKEEGLLVAAYDDARGVTAEFNRNVLHVLNRELGADFHSDRFEHVARWNDDENRIEMWLRSVSDQCVHIADLELDVGFTAGEELLTEISSKFTPESLLDELTSSGLEIEGSWTSRGQEFLLTMARPLS